MAYKFWLKFHADFFNQREIKKLRRLAGGDTLTIIYLKLQLLSIETEGYLHFEGTEETFHDQLSLEIDEDVENVKMTLSFLESNKLMEVVNDEYFLPEASKCIGSESESAERVRKFRERKALHCNALVTTSNALVTTSNTDIEEEVNNKRIDKNNKKEKTDFDLSEFSEELKQAFEDFIEMRKLIKEPMTQRAFVLLKKQLSKLADSDSTKIEIINQSVLNNWKTVYPLKEQQQMGKVKIEEHQPVYKFSKPWEPPVDPDAPPRRSMHSISPEERKRIFDEATNGKFLRTT